MSYAGNAGSGYYPQTTAPGFAIPQQPHPAMGGYPPNAEYPPNAGYPPNVNYPATAPYPQPQPPQDVAGYPPPYLPGGYPPTPQGPITQPPVPYGAGQGQNVPMTPVPQPMQGIPPGLEYLTAVDQLIIKQKVEVLEALIGFESCNKYSVKNSLGQKIFQASEKTDCCTRICCGASRPFEMKIKDLHGNEVIHLSRPLRCSSCWFPCFLQRLEVAAPPGCVIGYVCQEWSMFGPKFTVRDAQENVILRIEGPCCTCSICGDVEFDVISDTTGQNVGRISKQWSGLLREVFTDSDNFGVSFPIDLHVHVKATLLAAVFLIDFMFFEKSGNKRNDLPGMLD